MMTAATSVFTNADSDKEAIGEPLICRTPVVLTESEIEAMPWPECSTCVCNIIFQRPTAQQVMTQFEIEAEPQSGYFT
nr:unnamed protein product [Callosobruchus chinensis]